MIQKFVDRFMARKPLLEAFFSKEHPADYKAIVTAVVRVIGDDSDYARLDPERIHEIDDGHYQGTLLYVIGTAYQTGDYYYVKVDYGSCSGCDTLEGIRHYNDATPDAQQVSDYVTLALHIVQGLRSMQDREE